MKNPFWVFLAAVLTAMLCGIFVSSTALALGAALLLVLVLGVLWPWISLRGVTCQIRFEQRRGREGDPIPVEISVTNRWPWPVYGLSLTRGFVDDTDRGGMALAAVAGWSTGNVTWTFYPPRRGVYPLKAPAIETAFPFGLWRATQTAACDHTLLVWPRRTRLKALPDAVEIESREERMSDRRAGDVGDMLGTRGFRQGDSLRRVHWAQSARHGRLIVVERQAPASCAVRVVLDLQSDSHGGRGQERSLERMLRVAASIVESMHEHHAYVECVLDHDVYAIGPSPRELQRCLDAFARVPVEGLPGCHEHGLCCGVSASKRHGAMGEFVLTTPKGFAREVHRNHWSRNHHYVVVGARAAGTPDACHAHEHCGCRPWLELLPDGDVLGELPMRWQRACRVA